ncbi:MAG: hypothetical protein U5L45_00245 [Saprospiraceae bacterium]|nr:hypothetical protein [Saprospiraceae bacterium]
MELSEFLKKNPAKAGHTLIKKDDVFQYIPNNSVSIFTDANWSIVVINPNLPEIETAKANRAAVTTTNLNKK